MLLSFSSKNTAFSLKKRKDISIFLLSIIKKERKNAGEIHITFCNDRFLHSLNKKFLNHHTLTDIITFQYTTQPVSGELFISIPRVRENARTFNVSFYNELLRVMTHGVLHLCGYKDKEVKEKMIMRKKEDYYLKQTRLANE